MLSSVPLIARRGALPGFRAISAVCIVAAVMSKSVTESSKGTVGTPGSTSAEVAAHTLAMVGYRYRVDDFYEVGREKVREYARAVLDDHPAHSSEEASKKLGYSGVLAPLTFISIIGMIAHRHLFADVVTGYDTSTFIQVDQRIVFHRPITVGDRLVCDISVDSFRQMAGGDIIVTKNVITDQNGELVQTNWTTVIGRVAGEVDEAAVRAAKEVMMDGLA